MSTDPATLAPHVEPRWRDGFVVELRLRNVPGASIGDALAEVEAHCVDAGQDAETAFGDPVAYARGIAGVLPRRRTPVRDGAAVVVQTAGVVGVVWAVPPWLHGEPLALSGGMAASVIATLLVAVALCFAPAAVLGRLARVRWWLAGLAGSVIALVLAYTALLPGGALTAAAAPVVLVSVILLAAGAAALHALGATNDAVTGPGDDDAEGARRARRTSVLLSAALPAVALLAAGLLALLPR
ncbi:hypothetical protein [Cellulomonas sp. S1-8]|uniref:hypothetical protein n=1 Tax=Cellulomonas sp. S1-8 TaxID=2904790 RepID=UPI0022442F1B|nr:hypothetical protein [Cellulomonas sp. S1-8]UZN02896.1 hypothetical protein OKX07_17865 [Cellulomonas sp. S1-8]